MSGPRWFRPGPHEPMTLRTTERHQLMCCKSNNVQPVLSTLGRGEEIKISSSVIFALSAADRGGL